MAGTINTSVIRSSTTSPATFQDTNGTEIGTLCRAWAYFYGPTGAVSAGFNVSSVTRNGTGLYTVNFTNAMPDTNYAPCGFPRTSGSTSRFVVCASSQLTTLSTTQIAITVGDYSTTTDATYVGFTVFR